MERAGGGRTGGESAIASIIASQSGAMTLPEFFEKRLGRKVRQVAGVIIVLSGLLNMGVFLRMGGEFLIGVTGMANDGHQLEIMMSALLIGVCVYTILGGMLSVLVTSNVKPLADVMGPAAESRFTQVEIIGPDRRQNR